MAWNIAPLSRVTAVFVYHSHHTHVCVPLHVSDIHFALWCKLELLHPATWTLYSPDTSLNTSRVPTLCSCTDFRGTWEGVVISGTCHLHVELYNGNLLYQHLHKQRSLRVELVRLVVTSHCTTS